jgi:hypothetical protein
MAALGVMFDFNVRARDASSMCVCVFMNLWDAMRCQDVTTLLMEVCNLHRRRSRWKGDGSGSDVMYDVNRDMNVNVSRKENPPSLNSSQANPP